MNIGPVEYSYTDSERWVIAVVNGIKWEGVDLQGDVEIADAVRVWIAKGNTPAACSTGREMPPGLMPQETPPPQPKLKIPAPYQEPKPQAEQPKRKKK
jgi:hypothetical protein